MKALRRLIGLFNRNRRVSTECAHADHDLLASLLVMAWFVEARDPYTGGHLWRVSRYAQLLAEAAGHDEAVVARIALGGFLHDLGKIGVPDAILRKRGPLVADEFAVIRTHPQVGARLLAGHPLAGVVRTAVLSHHERPDGAGYPHGLAGHAIALDARVVGICDAFDAMTSARPYRRGMAVAEALAALVAGAGRQFDAQLCELFVELGRTGTVHHIVGHSDDGIPLHECLMCGPTLVRRREDAPGDRLYCRNCGGEYELGKGADGQLDAVATGKAGLAVQLEPAADNALIRRLIDEVADRIALPDLLAAI